MLAVDASSAARKGSVKEARCYLFSLCSRSEPRLRRRKQQRRTSTASTAGMYQFTVTATALGQNKPLVTLTLMVK